MAELVKPHPINWTERLKNWREALLTMNLPDERMDGVSRWLIITRAGVIPMTLTSGLIGGLLAMRATKPNWLYFLLSLIGLGVAHPPHKLINNNFYLPPG